MNQAAIVSVSTNQLQNNEPQRINGQAAYKPGKCASGKCGNEKNFAKVDTGKNFQNQLVRSRDGKCGVDGEGLNPPPKDPQFIKPGKCASGVCGA